MSFQLEITFVDKDQPPLRWASPPDQGEPIDVSSYPWAGGDTFPISLDFDSDRNA